ncbi:MAG: 30S ribosomal protein S17 [Candidatus Marinimicrobia bacterium]|nr:30S ribosomal protein S17 [Candidatus Neomarinimicrobiota bacterium]MCK4688793.1 30S ribosomal protein S17 [Candidatus Neomarinimicrobiota bacterium]
MALQGKRKVLIGTVISDKMDKTVVVSIERTVKHPVYGKYIRRTSKFFVHDPQNNCKQGDIVKISESRPISRKKRWRLLEVLDH